MIVYFCFLEAYYIAVSLTRDSLIGFGALRTSRFQAAFIGVFIIILCLLPALCPFASSRVQSAFVAFFGISVLYLRSLCRCCSSRVHRFLPRFVLALSSGVRARTVFTSWVFPPPRVRAPPQVRFFLLWFTGAPFVAWALGLPRI